MDLHPASKNLHLDKMLPSPFGLLLVLKSY